MAYPVVRFEIGCRNTSATTAFYAEMFGWQTRPNGPATTILSENGGIGGHFTPWATNRSITSRFTSK